MAGEWRSELPKEDGYYWLRHFGELDLSPTVVKIELNHNGKPEMWWVGTEMDWDLEPGDEIYSEALSPPVQ